MCINRLVKDDCYCYNRAIEMLQIDVYMLYILIKITYQLHLSTVSICMELALMYRTVIIYGVIVSVTLFATAISLPL
jgi:hypothetical protein